MNFNKESVIAFQSWMRFFFTRMSLQIIFLVIANIATANNPKIVSGEGDSIKILIFSFFLVFLFVTGFLTYSRSIKHFISKTKGTKELFNLNNGSSDKGDTH